MSMAEDNPIKCIRDAINGAHRGKPCSYDKRLCLENCPLGSEIMRMETHRTEVKGNRKLGFYKQRVVGKWGGSITCAPHARPAGTDPEFVLLAVHDPSCHWADQPCIFLGNLKWFKPAMDCLISILTHEIMHCVLVEAESIRADIQWDNISCKVIDGYDKCISKLSMSISETELEDLNNAIVHAHPHCLEMKSYEEIEKLIMEEERKKHPGLWNEEIR